MADKYPAKFLSATYSQKLESNPEALSELTSRQAKRQASAIWMISMFLFLYFAFALGVALLDAAESIFRLDFWSLLTNISAAVVHTLGMLAASLGFYCTKTLEVKAVSRFVVMLGLALIVYAVYLITWVVLFYDQIISKLKPSFKAAKQPEVAAAQFLAVIVLCGVSIAVYFFYAAVRLKELLCTWKLLNPRKDMTVRALSIVLDK